ncbi:MAG: DUF1176 domain-containing protein [Rhizobiaceae bacterium]
MTRLLLLATISALALSAQAWAGAYKQFREVTVSCTMGLTCGVEVAAKEQDASIRSITFERRAGPGTPLDLVLSASGELGNATVILSVDGKPVYSTLLPALAYDPDFYRYRLAGGTETLTLLDAFRAGATAELSLTGENSGRWTYALSGMVAGLIFVDEIQGRLETPDALQVKGDKASEPVMIRDITEIADIPAAIRARFEDPDGECSFFEESRFRYTGGFEAEVGDGYSLVGLPCADGGAYNQPYVFYAGSDADYSALPLPAMSEKGPTTTFEAWNIDWDHPKRVLTAFFKGRGIGDCGSWDKWELTAGPALPVFVLLESRAKGDCDGDGAGGPEKWPALWPVQ